MTAPDDALRSAVLRHAGGAAVLALVVLAVNVLGTPVHVFLLNMALLTAIGCLALNLQMGTAGQICMGVAAFIALGAFTAAVAGRHGLDRPWDLVLATVVTGAAGVVLGLPALRLHGLHFALASLSAFFIVAYVLRRYQSETVGEGGFRFAPIFEGTIAEGNQRWSVLLALVLAVVALLVGAISRGRTGRALRMIRDHDNVARVLGIRVGWHKSLVFGLGAALMGLQGALTAYYSGFVTIEQFTLALGITYLSAIIIGGLDSIPGAVVGAVVVSVLPTVASDSVVSILGQENVTKGPQIALILYGVLVIVFVTSSPDGVVGWVRRVASRIRGSRHRAGLRGRAPGEGVKA